MSAARLSTDAAPTEYVLPSNSPQPTCYFFPHKSELPAAGHISPYTERLGIGMKMPDNSHYSHAGGDSLIFAWNGELDELPERFDTIELARAPGVPLVFKILVSGGPMLTRSVTGTNWDPTSISGSLPAGRAKLLAFLDDLAGRQLFDAAELKRRAAGLVGRLANSRRAQWATLDMDSVTGEDAESPSIRRLAQSILAEVRAIDVAMADALAELENLRGEGRVDDMWQVLGLPEEHQGQSSLPIEGTARDDSEMGGQIRLSNIARPGSVMAICVTAIVWWVLSGIVAVLSAGDTFARDVSPTEKLVVLLVVAACVAQVFLAALVLRGSWNARTIFAVLTVVGMIQLLISLENGTGSPMNGVGVLVAIVSLVGLYSGRASLYFAGSLTGAAQANRQN